MIKSHVSVFSPQLVSVLRNLATRKCRNLTYESDRICLSEHLHLKDTMKCDALAIILVMVMLSLCLSLPQSPPPDTWYMASLSISKA